MDELQAKHGGVFAFPQEITLVLYYGLPKTDHLIKSDLMICNYELSGIFYAAIQFYTYRAIFYRDYWEFYIDLRRYVFDVESW